MNNYKLYNMSSLTNTKSFNGSMGVHEISDLSFKNLKAKCLEIQTKLKSDKEAGKLDPTIRIKISSVVGEDKIKKYITYFIRDTDIIKQTRTVKVTTVTKSGSNAVEERKQWNKFGEAKRRGNDGLIIDQGEVFFMKPDGSYLFNEDKEKDNVKKSVPTIKPTNNKPNAWRSRRILQKKTNPQEETEDDKKKYQFSSRRDDNDKTLFVSNLSTDTSEESLYSLFGQFGKVKFISMPKYRNGHNKGKPKGIAFVKFYNLSIAQDALAADGASLDYMKIAVKMANQDNK